MMASCQVSYTAKYKEKQYPKHDSKHIVYYTHQHVYVIMKDGKEVECIVRGRVSKTKYYVRQYKSRRQGNVHEKYMRPISDEELETLEEIE